MKGDSIFESTVAADALDNLSREEIKKNVEWISLKAGVKAFGIAAFFSVPGTYYALQKWTWFIKNTGTSGRVATAFIPPLFSFALVSEQTSSRLARPEAYERYIRGDDTPIAERITRFFDFSPAQFLIFAGIPTVGTIFYMNGRNSSLTFSQRVMHTRVMGQASVLAILTGVALYHFVTDDDEKKH